MIMAGLNISLDRFPWQEPSTGDHAPLQSPISWVALGLGVPSAYLETDKMVVGWSQVVAHPVKRSLRHAKTVQGSGFEALLHTHSGYTS